MIPIAAVLAVALAALPVAAVSSDPPTPSVQFWVQNWADAVTLSNPNEPGYAHLGGGAETTTVNALIDLHSSAPERFTATLVDAQAVDGLQPPPCIASTTPDPRNCVFPLAVGEGVNVLTLTIVRPGVDRAFVEQGWITGGAFRFSGGLEAQDVAGSWQRIPDGGGLRLPATVFTSVRYVVRNIGGVPFRVTGSCRDGVVDPGSSVTCPVTGTRPVASLASSYSRTIRLQDPTGSAGRIRFSGSVVPTAAAFRLDGGRAAVGQKVALHAEGLSDRDLGQLVVRIGTRPVRFDAESTPGRIIFAMPLVPAGPATLEVLEGGLTVARLPVTVTPRPVSGIPAAPFPVALVVLVSLGGAALAVLLWRGVSTWSRSRRRRSRSLQPTVSRTT